MADITITKITWAGLRELSRNVGAGTYNKHTQQMANKLLQGLVSVIDAEIKRKEMHGELLEGIATIDLDFEVRPYHLVEFDDDKPRNFLAEELEVALKKKRTLVHNK